MINLKFPDNPSDWTAETNKAIAEVVMQSEKHVDEKEENLREVLSRAGLSEDCIVEVIEVLRDLCPVCFGPSHCYCWNDD